MPREIGPSLETHAIEMCYRRTVAIFALYYIETVFSRYCIRRKSSVYQNWKRNRRKQYGVDTELQRVAVHDEISPIIFTILPVA